MKEFRTHNFPKTISVFQYQKYYEMVLEHLKLKFSECQIYSLGGKYLKPGISDLDFVILAKDEIDGNDLYLRDMPYLPRKYGALTHEPFGIDVNTFKWLKRITSYEMKRVYPETDMFGIEDEVLPPEKKYELIILALYLVANYPMNFFELRKEVIDIRRSITKLKKLLNIEKQFKKAFQLSDDKIINDLFKERLLNCINNIDQNDAAKLKSEVIWLLQNVDEVVETIFESFEENSIKYFGLHLENSNLSFKKYNLEFSDQWKNCLFKDGVYFLPKNLSLINAVFRNIDKRFLKNIGVGDSDFDFPECTSAGQAINEYLRFCDKSHILTLIFDYDFSIKGHNSLKYKIFRLLSGVKHSFILK